jgi:hypothetical protein
LVANEKSFFEHHPRQSGETEKRMPAMAAARGVFNRAWIKLRYCFI